MKPVLFPSVPRIYNKIYGALKAKFSAITGCKRWLLDRAIAAKLQNLERTGQVTHYCYDSLLFGEARAMLGGNVRKMVTGSAPIDPQILNFLKVVFGCPITEGYALTESIGGACKTRDEDLVTDHVGGPHLFIKLRLKSLPDMGYLVTDLPYPRGELLMQGPAMFEGYFK